MTVSTPAYRHPLVATVRDSGSAHRSDRHAKHRTRTEEGSRADWVRLLEIAAVLAIAIALIAAVVFSSSAQEPTSLRTSRAFVETGDTLWSLAKAHPVPGQSTEQTARQIAELNALDSSGLVAGSVLRLPQGEERAPMLAQR